MKPNSRQFEIEVAMVIRRRREALEISQYNFSRLCKLPSIQSVGEVERGNGRLYLTTLSQIAIMFGAPPSKILEIAENNIVQSSSKFDYFSSKNFDYLSHRTPLDPKTFALAVNSVLQEQRLLQGLNEVGLAKKAGLEERYVIVYEDTGLDISIESLYKLSMVLNTPTSKILALAERNLIGKQKLTRKKRTITSAYDAEKLVAAVARVLKDERKFQSMTQLELAQRSGFFKEAISYAEHHLRAISVKELFKLAGALDVPASTILARAEKEVGKRKWPNRR